MLSESPAPVRRLLRFLALPYCFFRCVNWRECDASPLRVVLDFVYIFFRLKYFPINYSQCRLWEVPRDEWKYYYGSVYDAWQRSRLRREVFRREYQIIYDDKSLSHMLCLANEIPVPRFLGVADPDDIKPLIEQALTRSPDRRVVIKPIAGRGGAGVHVSYLENGRVVVRGGAKQACGLTEFVTVQRSIVQEWIHQHPDLSQISPSVNTVRYVTLLTRSGGVLVVGAYMRFGIADSLVDNVSQGGILVGIDMKTGCLGSHGYDSASRRYERHPSSGVLFRGYPVPHWDSVMKLAERVQQTLDYNKLLGQDIAITSDGPLIIELNAQYDNVDLEQACGPILRNRRVLEAFDEYDLLINKPQKSLL